MPDVNPALPPDNGLPDNRKLEIYTELCEARALLWAHGLYSLHDAVDALAFFALDHVIDTNLATQISGKALQKWRTLP